MNDSCDFWEQKSTHFGKISFTVKELWLETQHPVKVELGPVCEFRSSNFIRNWITVVIPGVSVQIQPLQIQLFRVWNAMFKYDKNHWAYL